VDFNTGRVVTPDANGNISVTQNQTPGAAPPINRPPANGSGTGTGTSNAPPVPAVQAGMVKSNQEYSDKLAGDRATGSAQKATIDRIQSRIDSNPEFWGIDTKSDAWRAFVDVNSTNENRKASLDTLFRNLNIDPKNRAEFDQTMNDYRSLQVNAITGSGLSASQTNTEKESQRVISTIGDIGDRPAAAKATLEYAKAKIEYTDAKAKAWVQERRKNPGLDRLEFETTFDDTKGEKIFADANQKMEKILADAKAKQNSTGTSAGNQPVVPDGAGPKEGDTDVSKSGRPIIRRNGKWEYQ
jgi:hypothetical protein